MLRALLTSYAAAYIFRCPHSTLVRYLQHIAVPVLLHYDSTRIPLSIYLIRPLPIAAHTAESIKWGAPAQTGVAMRPSNYTLHTHELARHPDNKPACSWLEPCDSHRMNHRSLQAVPLHTHTHSHTLSPPPPPQTPRPSTSIHPLPQSPSPPLPLPSHLFRVPPPASLPQHVAHPPRCVPWISGVWRCPHP